MSPVIRQRVVITGVVQGVGFRPHVATVAARFPVTGFCGNDDLSVFLEVQGSAEAVSGCVDAVVNECPTMASIYSVSRGDRAPVMGETEFTIVASTRQSGALTLLPADTATCADCLADMADPNNRRYGYPFTTCTNCGPRLSIITDVPYDRPLTTMADFPLCAQCEAEYRDPADRRYHAQPISCFDCGPRLWLEKSGNSDPVPATSSADPRAAVAGVIAAARGLLAEGKILAVKGIGGFALMCDARHEEAVSTLRERKRRPGKPFAVMAGSVDAARTLCSFSDAALAALTSPAAPIVLTQVDVTRSAVNAATVTGTATLAPSVAPGLGDLGIMLPYAPLHRLLLRDKDVLVATSANTSDTPLTYRNEDARRDLSHIVDAFVMHDRPIAVPVEDSVVMAVGERVSPVRRSRGYAPLPVMLPEPAAGSGACVLAVGAELKNTFALTRDGMAFVSAHIGDMGTLETQAAFEKSVDQMMTAHRRKPEVVIVDQHPRYATRAWGLRTAERLGVPTFSVQHHHAHALSLAAEGNLPPGSVCIVMDGTGYGEDDPGHGEDGTASSLSGPSAAPEGPTKPRVSIWGGEILRLGEDLLAVTRAAHLPEFSLPGGDSAVKHPWKTAVAVAWEYGLELPDGWLEPTSRSDSHQSLAPASPSPASLATVQSMLRQGLGTVRTTSAGRYCDAASSILGVCHSITYEAQAAMELENVARHCPHTEAHRPPDGTVPEMSELFQALITGVNNEVPVACLARQFHSGLASIVARYANVASQPQAPIGLSGGCLANRLLLHDIERVLRWSGHDVITHRVVPCNDGGLALGQALAGVLALGRH